MITAAELRSHTVKELGQMAKQAGVPGWHGMRKEQLVRALLRLDRRRAAGKQGGKRKRAGGRAAPSGNGGEARTRGGARQEAAKSARVLRRIHQAHEARRREKDLAGGGNGCSPRVKPGNGAAVGGPRKDRIVLLVRDPYWLQVCWELTRRSVERAKAAMGAHWHTAKPVLRLIELDGGATTSAAERVARDIEIHGAVRSWFIDVRNPPQSYRVDIGYLAANGKFFALARSNQVATPADDGEGLAGGWVGLGDDYEKIYALSGGYAEPGADSQLRELFEERLQRPMGPCPAAKFGAGAERFVRRQREFAFDIDAEMVVHGATKPDARVTLAGEPVKLRPDGTFSVRLSLPNRRQVLPVVAHSADGVEQRTIVLAVERNTKVMEPVIHESDEA